MNDEVKTKDVAQLMSLFEGFTEAYGTYDGTSANEGKGGKLEIKATAKTKRSKVTLDLWERHVAGVSPLGIIPIRDNDTCLWGVIDIDQYALDHVEIIQKIRKEKLPLIVCRSKSGGAHLFLFMKEPIEATLVITRLNEMAALLGYGASEIFPKQRTVHVDRGDLGSWLNMPYFEGEETTRYAVKDNGLAMTLGEFIRAAEDAKVDRSFLEKEKRKKPQNDGGEFGDGPPCMQHLMADGFPEGVRNKGLYALAIFAKKKFGVKWPDFLEEWNRRVFEPPLPAIEILDIINRVEKKDYNYPCKEQPLLAHCNSALCRTRRFGVGGADEYPTIGGLSVLTTEPPLWFMDVDDTRLELTTDELRNYNTFQKVCMERTRKMYRSMKVEAWNTVVREAMAEVVEIEAPREVGITGRFEELLESFVTDRHKADNRDELLLGKPWHDEEEQRYYFRLKDLEKYLETAGFKIYGRAQMTTRIKSMGGGDKFFNLKGKGCNTWFIPSVFIPVPELPLPGIERDPI